MSSIFIFRRDYRIYDNIGFIECMKNNKKVYPIFIFTPEQIKTNDYKSSNAVQFLIESLKELENDINLNIFFGKDIKVLKKIINKEKIESIYTNTDYTPYSKKRDKKLQKFCNKLNIKLSLHHDICLFEPGTIKNKSGKTYQKFTPFYKTVLKLDSPNKPVSIKNIKTYKTKNKYSINWEETNKYYTFNKNMNTKGGRKNGLKIVNSIKNHKEYDDTRNQLSLKTTHLSSYIKFGCVSIREVYHKLLKEFGKEHSLIRQLIWRDFYYHLGFKFPKVFGKPLKSKYEDIKWSKDNTTFKSWTEGETGFPVVDASMRQLNNTGYMHNRGRLIVASFLIKNLQHNWLKGEKYFAQKLIDYDPLVNNGNWQWVSSTGADSQPYFRIFNPWTQSKKFDKDCEYIKKWIPELKEVNPKHIHQWDKYYNLYENIDYPKPIIDYKKSREITLNIYKKSL